ncbi:hypothetical protein ACH4VT_13335 [Streptomyces lydicus]|uniref:hypothetical protein n=1 Tax=Streptomyces lydicus TaxID=47763 RepID=UPI003794A2B9
MCDDHGHSAAEAVWSAARVAEGPAVDPVTLPEVDEVRATTERLGIDVGGLQGVVLSHTSTTRAASTAWPGCAGAPVCR